VVTGALFTAHAASIISFRYGQLERSREVTRAFEAAQVSSEYNYYYTGIGNIPFAIIGIDKSHQLRPGMWQPIELTPQILRGWIRQMDIIYDGFPPYGSHILDDNGKQIGVWYSSKQWTTVIIEDDSQVAVLAPEPPGFGRP
jgi:hypothetical protein